jgi:hypothetical protein
MSIDLNGAEGGRMAAAFATGCTAAWVFVRNLVMKPAIKSCHQRIAELTEDRNRLVKRVEQLETILMTRSPGDLAAAVQASLSENHIEIELLKRKVEG